MFAFPSPGVFLVTLAIVSASQANLSNHVRSLLSRQNDGTGAGINPDIIPPKCRDICAPINDISSNICTTPDCICGTRISDSMFGCLQCALDVSGLTSLIPQAQETYDNYAQLCSNFGKSVPSHTFKINSGSSSGSSSSSTSVRPVSSSGPTPTTRGIQFTITSIPSDPTPSPTPQVPADNPPPAPTTPLPSGASGAPDNTGGTGGISSRASRIPIASASAVGALAAMLLLMM